MSHWTRRSWLVRGALLMAASCTKTHQPPQSRIQVDGNPHPPDQAAVLVFLPETRDTIVFWGALRDELSSELEVVRHVVDEATTPEDLEQALRTVQPSAVVLVDNQSVTLYKKLQVNTEATAPLPPAVAVMTSFLGEYLHDLHNTIGIAYEVPLVRTITALRTFVARDIHKVGVLRRSMFSGFIANERLLAERERIEIVEVEVTNQPSVEELRRGLRELLDQRAVDAVWALNDEALLTEELLNEGWRPELRRHPTPVLVGVMALVGADMDFGAFAALPDHAALAVQVAEMLFELAEADWNIDAPHVDLPFSVRTAVALEQVQEHFGLAQDAWLQVDVVLE